MAKSDGGIGQPLNWQPYSFPMVGGVETKVDGIALPPPRLQKMENAYVEHTGSARKRNGYTNVTTSCFDGTTFSGPLGCASFDGNLLAFGASGAAYEYGVTGNRWAPKGTKAYSVRLTSRGVSGAGEPGGFWQGDHASVNNWSVDAWVEALTDSSGNTVATLRVSVTDSAGTIYANGQSIQSVTSGSLDLKNVQCVVRGSIVYVLFHRASTTAIRVFRIDTTSTATVVSSLAGAASNVVTDAAATGAWDADNNSSVGVLLVYVSTTARTLKWGFVDTTGAMTHTSSYLAPNQPTEVACAVSPGLAMHGFAYLDGSGPPNDVYALHRSYNSGTGVWTATATSTALDTAMVADPTTICCQYDQGSSTTLRVWYSEPSDPTLTSTDYSGKVYQATYTTAGVIASRVVTRRKSFMVSKPFAYGSDVFYWVYAGPLFGTTQPGYYLIRSSDSVVVAWARAGTAWPSGFFALKLASVTLTGATGNVATMTAAYMRKIVNTGSFAAAGTIVSQMALSVTFDHDQAYGNVDVGDAMMMADGFLKTYDGATFGESDFLRFVDGSTIAQSFTVNVGAFTASATYYYWFIYTRTSVRGRIYLGTASAPVTVTQGAAPKEVQFKIPTLCHTNHSDVYVACYRTAANPASADEPAVLIGQVANNTAADEVTFKDNGTAVTAEPLYLIDEVDNVAPPAGHLVAVGNGRVFLAGFEDDPNMVRFSKLRQQGQGVQFADSFQILTPNDGGAITALAVMGDLLIIFKQSRIYVVDIRSGPTNAINNQAAFPEPRLISTDTGCASQRSVVLTPLGLMFWPIDGRAIYLLDQSLQVSYIGSPVESSFRSGVTVIGSILDAGRQHVRWALSNNAIVVYDYFHKLWSTYALASSTGVVGPMTMLNDEVAMPLSSSLVGLEDSAVYTDGTGAGFYGMTLRLAWVSDDRARLGSFRFRRLGFVGICQEGTQLIATAYVDYDNQTSTDTITANLAANSQKAFRVFDRLSQQLAHAMEIVVTDEPTYGSQAFSLTAVEFEMAARKPVFGRPVPSGS